MGKFRSRNTYSTMSFVQQFLLFWLHILTLRWSLYYLWVVQSTWWYVQTYFQKSNVCCTFIPDYENVYLYELVHKHIKVIYQNMNLEHTSLSFHSQSSRPN